MKIIPEAMEHILNNPGGKKRFLREVTALIKAFSLSVTSKESEQLRDEVGFFQAIKASIIKNTETNASKKSIDHMNSAIKHKNLVFADLIGLPFCFAKLCLLFNSNKAII